MGFVVPISVRPGCCSGSMAGARPRQRRALPGELDVCVIRCAFVATRLKVCTRFGYGALLARRLRRLAWCAHAPPSRPWRPVVGGAAVVLLPRRVCERDAPQYGGCSTPPKVRGKKRNTLRLSMGPRVPVIRPYILGRRQVTDGAESRPQRVGAKQNHLPGGSARIDAPHPHPCVVPKPFNLILY